MVWNTRDPSARPGSGQARSYKPKAKSRRAQRESEGIVVPMGRVRAGSAKAVWHNAAGGKGPCGGHADGAGKREGMAGETGPNDPDDQVSSDKVRQLQRQLWAAAKRAPGGRVHAQYRASGGDVLQVACKVIPAAAQHLFVGTGPHNAASRRPLVSRVREIRMHGLNGGVGSNYGLRAL